MVSKDFNDFMDSYIEDVRSKKPTVISKGKVTGEQEPVPEGVSSSSVYVIKKPKGFFQRIWEKITLEKEEDFVEKPRTEKTESVQSEEEFEQEYDEISRDEKKTSLFGWIMKFFTADVDEEYEDMDMEEKAEPIELKGSPKTENELTNPNQEFIADTSEEVEEDTVMQKILNFFGVSVSREPPVEHVYPEKPGPSIQEMIVIKEDLKEIAAIAIDNFKKLPKVKFEAFKKSSDFETFKRILKKHSIIREK